MSLSAVREPAETIATVETLLRPGGRLVVLDGQPFRQWPWTLANELIVPISKRTTNWRPEIDIPSALRRTFATVEVETFNAGTVLLARAFKNDFSRRC